MARRGRARGPRLFFIGWVLIVVVFGGLFGWSALAPFEGAVTAQGKIEAETSNKAVQHLGGGNVAEILVRDGDTVEAGDVLIRLDGTNVLAQLASTEAQLFEALAVEARLIAERDGKDDLEVRSGIGDLEDSEELAEKLELARILKDSRAQNRTTQMEVLGQRIVQLERRIEGLQAEVVSKNTQMELIGEELVGLESLFERGLADRSLIFSKQRESSQLLGEREALEADIAATNVRIGETQLEIAQLTEGFRESVLAELSEKQTEIARLLQSRAALLDERSRLEIRAPETGKVISMRVRSDTDVVSPGEDILYIVPKEDRLIASVEIAPQDIDKVEQGQSVNLQFVNLSQDETPQITGQIMLVSADAMQRQDGVSFYKGIVELPEDMQLPDNFVLRPGMQVTAFVRTDTRTVLSYLIKPARDAMSRTFRE